jgi:hypothetical protein
VFDAAVAARQCPVLTRHFAGQTWQLLDLSGPCIGASKQLSPAAHVHRSIQKEVVLKKLIHFIHYIR